MDCKCNMFLRLGICWHTGYKPTLEEREKIERDLPAVRRMKKRVISPQEQKERENDYNVRPRD